MCVSWSTSTDLKEMCELLGIEQTVLERAFSYRTVEAKMEKVSTTLNVAQVRERVTNLPRTSYTNVFLLYLHSHYRTHTVCKVKGLFFSPVVLWLLSSRVYACNTDTDSPTES